MKKAVFVFLLALFVCGVSFAQTAVPEGFVRIQGGSFVREGQTVTVSAFYMGRYEVTQGEYEEIMGTNPSHFRGPNLPVEMVTWFDAIEYCNRLSIKEGLTPAYTIHEQDYERTVTWNRNANGYRLPTEAEWEYACRAGTTTTYSWGDQWDDATAGQYAYYENNSGKGTQEVGTKQPNAFGLFDMHGNVWEWCWDWYDTIYPAGNQNPTGAPSGSRRVFRGGGWGSSVDNLHSAYRSRYNPYDRFGNLGFRVVRP